MSEARVVATGIAFGESPRWHDGRLWVSDWGAQEVLAVDPADGRTEAAVKVPFPSLPMCIDWLPDGRLLLVSSSEGRLVRREPDGTLATYADLSGLGSYPWNEVLVDGRGNAYVNNIGFDFPEGEVGPGFVAVVTPDGAARQVADGLMFPNGMAITPDGATLIVAESYASQLTSFDIAPDGGLSNRRVWAETPGDHPDGICLDADGAAWYADVANQHCVRVAEGGEVLATVEIDRGCFACVLGGPDRGTLFVVAQEWDPETMGGGDRTGQVLAVSAPAPGAGRP